MKVQTCILVVILCIFSTISGLAEGLTIHEGNYTARIYSAYSSPDLGGPMGMAFDGNGNLYVTQRGTGDVNFSNGSIYKITPDGNASQWVTGIIGPRRIVWTGGTSYGDNLYVAESTSRDILKISLAGDVSAFSHISYYPHAMAIDRTGAYGDMLYSASRGTDHIHSIGLSGHDEVFGDFPGVIHDGPMDLTFDSTGRYDNSMYIAILDDILQGIYEIDPSGKPRAFAPFLYDALSMSIDESGLMFGGDFFALGHKRTGEGWGIYRVIPSGEISLFINGLNLANHSSIAFGPNGALYIAEDWDGEVTITEITAIPEPATPSEQIADILDFINISVADGTLVGTGPAISGMNRLDVFIMMVENAEALINSQKFGPAMNKLDVVLQRCSGDSSSTFVGGPATEELVGMILQLQSDMEGDD